MIRKRQIIKSNTSASSVRSLSSSPTNNDFPKKQSRLLNIFHFALATLGGGILTAAVMNMNITQRAGVVIDIFPPNDNHRVVAPTSNDFQLAKQESFGFFDDIPTYQWLKFKEIFSIYQPHASPKDPHEDTSDYGQLFYQENYEPNFSCPFELRIGRNGDGGKWICDPHRIIRMVQRRKEKKKMKDVLPCLIYSVGSNGDFSFETAIQKYMDNGKLCEVHIFDFGDYEKDMPKNLNLHYHQWGFKEKEDDEEVKDGKLVGNPKPGQKYYTFAESVKLLGHEGRDAIDIFKIDCEYCEWNTYEEWTGPSIPKIMQIQVELHDAPEDSTIPFFTLLMKDNNYVIFHKEPNTMGCGGGCIEFSFLKLDKGFFKASA